VRGPSTLRCIILVLVYIRYGEQWMMVCVCMCVCVCVCVCVKVWSRHARTHAHTHTHIYDLPEDGHIWKPKPVAVQHNLKYRTECAGCKIDWVHIIRLVPAPVIRPLFATFVLVPKNHSGYSTCGHYLQVPWQRPATTGNPANLDTLCFGTQLLSENRPIFTVATTQLLLTSPVVMHRFNLKPDHCL
jgi:hypothetical protein